MASIKDETISGVKWQLIQRITMQPLNLIFSILIARFLVPADFGIVALTSIFFAIAQQLCNAGFGTALIRKIDRTDKDINTVYWYNVGMSFCMACLLFIAAPWFASFFKQPALVAITRVSAGLMFLSSFGAVLYTLYTCRRDFKSLAIFNMIGALCSMPVCLILAWKGFGYWALIGQSVTQSVISLTIVWIKSPWRPSFIFSKSSFKEFFAFGNRLVLFGFLDVGYTHSKNLLIGKFYNESQLGTFNRAYQLASTPSGVINGILGSVTFPILATIQHDEERLISVYRRYIRITSLAIFFGGFLFFATAKPLITLLYGENWLECIPYAQIIVLGVMCFHYGQVNNNLLLVKGRSDLVLRTGVYIKLISFLMLIPALFINITAVCWISFAFFPVNILISSFYTNKLFGLTRVKQLMDIMPYFIYSALCVLPAYTLCQWGTLPHWLALLISIPLSILLYVTVLITTKNSAWEQLLQIAHEKGIFDKLRKIIFWKKKTN